MPIYNGIGYNVEYVLCFPDFPLKTIRRAVVAEPAVAEFIEASNCHISH